LSDANGPTHQAIEDISLMRGIPHMQVFCPADETELVEGIPKIIESRAPCYVRYFAGKPAVQHSKTFEIGKAEVLSEGRDVTILAFGFLLREADKAKEILEADHYGVGLINLRTLKPIDEEVILKSANNTRLLVTLEDHFLAGGLYSIVSELLVKHQQRCRVLPIALENRWFKPALLDDVLQNEGFTGKQVAEKIIRALTTS